MTKINYKKILVIGGGVLGTVVILVIGLLIYLHQGRFEVAYNQVTLGTYLQKDMGTIVAIDGQKMTIDIPEDVLNTLLNERIQGLALSEKEQVVDGYMDTTQGKAYINMLLRGLYVPIAMETVFETTDRTIHLAFQNMQLKDKKLLGLPKSTEKKLQDKWQAKMKQLSISLDDFAIPDSVVIDEVKLLDESIHVVLSMKQEQLVGDMKTISTSRSEELYNLYQGMEGVEGQAVELMGKGRTLTTQDTEAILQDIFYKDQQLVKHIMVMTDEDNMNDVFDTYGRYLKKLNKQDIMQEKYRLILGKIETYCMELLDALEALPKEDYIVFANKPYAYRSKQSLTTEDMIAKGELQIPEDVSGKMTILYNYEKQGYIIAYMVNEDTYAIVGKDYYDFIDKQGYEAYSYLEPGDNTETVDLDIKKKIEELFQMEVFIRYMNTDGQYAFAIASPRTHYQDYERVALQKVDDLWQVVGTGINDLYDFSINNPGFNLKTITDRDMNDKIYALTTKDISVMMDQLVYCKIVEDKKSASIIYCSYDGEYIALKLDNGEEYVLNIRYAYLDKIYEKDIAITKWKDISPLILLQDYEEEEVVDTSEDTKVVEGQEDTATE